MVVDMFGLQIIRCTHPTTRVASQGSPAPDRGLGYSAAMQAWVRTVLVWLLVLALPMQGAAAATLAFCNPRHHASASAAGATSATSAHSPSRVFGQLLAEHPGHTPAMALEKAPHTHAQPAPTGAGGDEATAALEATASSLAPLAPAAADVSASKWVDADAHKCSACAACCAAAMLGRTVLHVPKPGVAATVFTAVVPTVEKFSADGPDRPPRPPAV